MLSSLLAALVVWMAENWSTSLPVPEMPRTGRAGALEVAVLCDDPADFARVVALLGVEPSGYPSYDGEEGTYRFALRWFGRVAVEAWRYEQ